jgi:hypothetical protein
MKPGAIKSRDLLAVQIKTPGGLSIRGELDTSGSKFPDEHFGRNSNLKGNLRSLRTNSAARE